MRDGLTRTGGSVARLVRSARQRQDGRYGDLGTRHYVLEIKLELVQHCDINVQYAHGSTHVTGTINVVSTINCQPLAPVLYQQTVLYKTTGSMVGDQGR